MSWGIVASVGGSIVGGLISSNGSKKAAQTQADAANAANETNLEIFNKQTELQEPFRQNGLAATNRLSYLLGLPQTSGTPGAAGAAAGGAQPLTQGPDGSYAPAASFNERAYLSANPDVAQYIAEHPAGSVGATTAQQHYDLFGKNEGRPTGVSNNFDTPGGLTQQFSKDDFAADGAPKTAPFTQTPDLPTFDQQAPNVPTLENWQGKADLSGYEDMPAFNASMMKDDPGYQFRLNEGLKGVDRSAAARGGALSGAAVKAAARFGQDYASNEFGNSFTRYQTTRGNKLQSYLTNRDTTNLNRTNGLQDYTTNRDTANQNYSNKRSAFDTNFNQFQVGRTNAVNDWKDALSVYSMNRANGMQDYQDAYNRFQTDRGNVINPLLSVMGAGQQATNQQSAAAQNYGAQSAAAVTSAGNARAAGQVGSANAINGGFANVANMYQQNQLMNLLRQPQTTTTSTSGYEPWQTTGTGMPAGY